MALATRLRARRLRQTILPGTLLFCLLPFLVHALPEDASQPIVIAGEQGEVDLNLGISILYGTAASPASVTQGSMMISGLELTLQRGEDGELLKVTASGSPARYQQQPEADQAIVHASGMTLTFDNVASMMTAEGDARFSQGETVLTGHHIEYNLETRRASFSRSPSEQIRITLPPPPQNKP